MSDSFIRNHDPRLPMSPRQEQHLRDIQIATITLLDRKYRRGNAEHGGSLLDWGAEALIEAAIEEALDQLTYLITALEKLKGLRCGEPECKSSCSCSPKA